MRGRMPAAFLGKAQLALKMAPSASSDYNIQTSRKEIHSKILLRLSNRI